jgi:hypothetical protein
MALKKEEFYEREYIQAGAFKEPHLIDQHPQKAEVKPKKGLRITAYR